MRILFPCIPGDSSRIDPDFADEAAAASRAGFPVELAQGSPLEPARSRPFEPALYRGWMLSGERYQTLWDACTARGFALATSPDEYMEVHYLPLAYPKLAGLTAETSWIEGTDLDEAWRAARTLGDGPIFLKDWVKSAKRRWPEACIVEDTRDRSRFEAACKALLEERRGKLNRGLVFRRWIPLQQRGTDLWGKPIHEETRVFFWRGRALSLPGWSELPGAWQHELERVARSFSAPFVVLDSAPDESGRRWIIEAGDGGVTGVPPSVPDEVFYRALWQENEKPQRPGVSG